MGAPHGSLIERFWRYVDMRGPRECWPWTGSLNDAGYGQLAPDKSTGDRSPLRAHRVSYELNYGVIPSSLVVDHLCHNDSTCPGGAACLHRRCVNPNHLEAVTLVRNISRGKSPSALASRDGLCHNGHDVTDPANVYVTKKGYRQCRPCRRDRQRKGRAAKKEQSA